MLGKVLAAIRKYDMLSSGDSVIVALSGGADSMSLLHVLLSLKDELSISVSAAHVNHCLRGEESDGDEHFVRSVCENLCIKLHVLRADIAAESEKTGEGTEECGRRIRYEFFNSIDEASKIATAHTQSDNLETVLLNLTRGSGLNGLCGIPPVRGRVIRPLIGCARAEVLKYCGDNGITYVTDKSNLENDYNRNKIRNLVVPHLMQINPAVEAAVGRCAESLREDEGCLSSLAAGLLHEAETEKGYQSSRLLQAHPSIRKRAVNMLLRERMTEKPQKHHIDLIDNALKEGGAVQTQNNVSAVVKNGLLTFTVDVKHLEPWRTEINGDTAVFPYGTIRISIFNISALNRSQKICKRVLANCLDYDKINSKSFFRSRQEGDRITQPRGGCTKTLKKLFNEKGIPVEKRNGIVVLADDEGVLWVEGYGCDRRAMISDSTQRVMMIGVERDEDVD